MRTAGWVQSAVHGVAGRPLLAGDHPFDALLLEPVVPGDGGVSVVGGGHGLDGWSKFADEVDKQLPPLGVVESWCSQRERR